MKVEIPKELKADVPPSTWGKMLTATPVIMAVVATMLAGLSSSEMTRAQYDRSYAAQQQSKAGDQWSFFQAKRLRGAMQHSTLEILQQTTQVRPFDAAALKQAVDGTTAADKAVILALMNSDSGQQALSSLQQGIVPHAGVGQALEPNVKAAMDAIESFKPETEIAALLAQVSEKTLDDSLRKAVDQTRELDAATKPVNQTIDQIANLLARAPALAQEHRDFAAARLHYVELRYEAEARLNQAIGNLYELKIRKGNISAERHHARSQRFFYGMLAAQLGVIIATFAMAARQRNLLWSIAAVAGLAAIAIAIYVYMWV